MRVRANLTRLLVVGACLALAAGLVSGIGSAQAQTARRTTNPVTPGNFTGYGFDQCLAPTQQKMDAWLYNSPYWAVGIYISGNSRACRSQPNLTPTWVSAQLTKGWRLLPITLGPQAACSPRFPRYNDDPTIRQYPGANHNYDRARAQGTAEASKTVTAATVLGIVPGSVMYYDLEGFDSTKTRCRESALAFLSAWTVRIRQLGYLSGVYSSASSGIKMLDDARVQRPGKFALPDQIWIARWDGVANTSTSYIRSDGWQPGGRIKQYVGGHNETWGRTTINIDRNYLAVGRGSVATPEVHCAGVKVDWPTYTRMKRGRKLAKALTLQCLLKEAGTYNGPLNSIYDQPTQAAGAAWMQAHGFAAGPWMRPQWEALLAQGAANVVKWGAAGPDVRRLQRALNAAGTAKLTVGGVFDTPTYAALRQYQSAVGLPSNGIVAPTTWAKLQTGTR